MLEADNVFARQGWEGGCSESLIIDEERRFPHRKDWYGFCIGVPCRDALVGLLDYIDKKDIFFLQAREKSRKGFFLHSREYFQNIRRALCILGRKTIKNLSEPFFCDVEGVGSLDDTQK